MPEFSQPAGASASGKTRLGELAAVVLLAALVSAAGIASHSLWTPDEPRDAAVGKASHSSATRNTTADCVSDD